jgi:hypothetical protein
MVKKDRPAWHLIAGFLITIGSWFRFHYISFAFLYPLLVAIYHWSDQRGKRALWTVIGVLLGLSVPAILCYTVFGVFSISNQKLQFAINAPDFSWSVPYFQRLENLSLLDLIRQISWTRLLGRFVWICLRAEFLIFLVIIALHLLSSRPPLQSRANQEGSRNWIRTVTDIGKKPSATLCLYLMLSVLPLLFIRGLALRHEVTVFIIAFPLLGFIYSTDKNRYQVGLLLALLLVSISMDVGFAMNKLNRTKYLNSTTKEILRIVPNSVLKQRPEKVFSSVEFYNPHDQYRLCSPVITGGWTLLSESMRESYGVMDVRRMHEDKDRLNELFEYIILRRNPREGGTRARYNAAMLSLDARYYYTERFVIIHLKRPALRKGANSK